MPDYVEQYVERYAVRANGRPLERLIAEDVVDIYNRIEALEKRAQLSTGDNEALARRDVAEALGFDDPGTATWERVIAAARWLRQDNEKQASAVTPGEWTPCQCGECKYYRETHDGAGPPWDTNPKPKPETWISTYHSLIEWNDRIPKDTAYLIAKDRDGREVGVVGVYYTRRPAKAP